MKKYVALLALAFASLAQAALVQLDPPNTVTPGVDTGVYGEQTCPPPVGCVESGNTLLTFGVDTNPGSMSLAFFGVVDPSAGGAYSFDVEVRDPLSNLLAAGFGTPNLLIPSFNVLVANGYTIDIDWAFSGNGTAQTASWGVVAATSAQAVPEPGTLALMALALLAVGYTQYRRT
jgi:hypothetical protein